VLLQVLAFKLEVDLPQLSCSLSRLEVFMAKLVFSSLRYTLSLAKAKEDGGGGAGGGKMEEELGEKDTKEDKDDDEEAALGSLLEQHGEVVLDDEESSENKQWCAHVDNSIHLGIKHLEINALPEEVDSAEGSEEPGLLLLLSGFTATIWPAQTSIKKVLTANRSEHELQVWCLFLSIKETSVLLMCSQCVPIVFLSGVVRLTEHKGNAWRTHTRDHQTPRPPLSLETCPRRAPSAPQGGGARGGGGGGQNNQNPPQAPTPPPPPHPPPPHPRTTPAPPPPPGPPWAVGHGGGGGGGHDTHHGASAAQEDGHGGERHQSSSADSTRAPRVGRGCLPPPPPLALWQPVRSPFQGPSLCRPRDGGGGRAEGGGEGKKKKKEGKTKTALQVCMETDLL